MTAASPISPKSPTREAAPEVLTFCLAGRDFCLPITSVREIRSWSDPTPLPLSDPSLLGVINLRGTILPIIDLAHKLRLSAARSRCDVIIVVACAGRLAGFAVDRVADILTFAPDALSPPPALANTAIAAGLSGMILAEGRCLPVLDATRLMPQQNRDRP